MGFNSGFKGLNSSDFGPFPLLLIARTLPVIHSHPLQLAQKAVMQPQNHRTVLVRYPGHMSRILLIIITEAFRGLLFVFPGELGRVYLFPDPCIFIIHFRFIRSRIC